jgi:TRAP-type transport system periplasmic protein
MSGHVSRRAFVGAASGGLASFAVLRHARGESPVHIRCSLDTAPSHLRNVAMVDYLDKVQKASGGRITAEVFHAGQLYADLNVSRALLQGQVEMCAPGAWTLTGLVPDFDFVQLPAFYGQPADVTHRATDGAPGKFVQQQVETKLRAKGLGPWIDLGYQNWYTTKTALHSIDDLRGLKLRSPGGAAISWRIRFVGGIPNTTAWPNVPLALSQGTFDGFVSTDESVSTAKLWEAGVRYCLADHQFMGQYVPLISQATLAKLSPELRDMMFHLWAENIPTYRNNMAQAQLKARQTMEANGVQFTDPTPQQLAEIRHKMTEAQQGLIQDAKLSSEVVRLVQAAIGNAS